MVGMHLPCHTKLLTKVSGLKTVCHQPTQQAAAVNISTSLRQHVYTVGAYTDEQHSHHAQLQEEQQYM